MPGWDLWREQTSRWLTKEYMYNENRPCRNGEPHEDKTACKFDIKAKLGPVCGREGRDMYGYKTGQPCLYFKLNRIFGVENEYVAQLVASAIVLQLVALAA